MKPPIIVSFPGDISIFRSVQEAERYLEPPDVKESRDIVYDCEGRRLSLEVLAEPDSKFLGITISGVGIEKVSIGREESSPVYGEELRQLLIDYLVRIGAPLESLQQGTLEDVLGMAIKRLGFER